MLNDNERKIAMAIQDKETLDYLNILPTAIKKAVIMAKEEVEELEKRLLYSFEKGEPFETLCQKLKGEDAMFDAKYPDYNCFDISYGSLHLTVEEHLDENNNKLKPQIYKDDIDIYPDNVCDMMGTDSLFSLNFNEDIDFENINMYLRTQGCKEVQKLLKNFFETFDKLKSKSVDRVNYKESKYNHEKWLDVEVDKYHYSDLLGCMLDMEDECYRLLEFSNNMLNEIKQFKSIYMETVLESDKEPIEEENEEEQ